MRYGSLWRHADFVRLWSGQSISLLGSAVTQLALPLVAVLVLGATPTQMGVLTAAQAAPVVVIGLVTGVWVDRVRRRPLMIASDIIRAALLGCIPAAAVAGVLRLEHLYVVAILVGTFSTIFNVAASAFIPVLVGREHLIEANSKLVASESLAEVAGPPLAGILIQLLTAPLAIALDAGSFLVSALSLVLVRAPAADISPPAGETLTSAIGEGLSFMLRRPVLRALAATAATGNFFASMIAAVYVLYAVRELELSPALIGGISATGSVGGLVGAVAAGRFVGHFGIGPAMVGVAVLMGLASLLLPVAGGPPVAIVSILVLAWLLRGLALPVFNITLVSLRQAMTPDRLQGRVNATSRVLTGSAAPLGALLGGALGEAIGLRPTLTVGALGLALAGLWIVLSPVRGMHHPPAATTRVDA